MTCIVGIAHEGTVWMGGDSMAAGGFLDSVILAHPKIVKNKEFLLGSTGSMRVAQLLEHSLDPPAFDEGEDVYHYLVTKFAEAVRMTLRDGGIAKKEHEVEEGGHFLIGARGRIFEMQSDYSIVESKDNYLAAGCGAYIALGALHATEALPPKKRVERALEAAAHFSPGVRGPFTILSNPAG